MSKQAACLTHTGRIEQPMPVRAGEGNETNLKWCTPYHGVTAMGPLDIPTYNKQTNSSPQLSYGSPVFGAC